MERYRGFHFYKSMEAYKNAFGKSDTKIIIGTDNPFLKYFESRDRIENQLYLVNNFILAGKNFCYRDSLNQEK